MYNKEIQCPICNGTGMIYGNKCPFNADVEPDCENCTFHGNCGNDDECKSCDGDGYVSQVELKAIIKSYEN